MATFLTSNLVPTGGAARATTAIVNGTSTAGDARVACTFSTSRGTKITDSGALTAATLKNIISVSGTAGKMPQLALKTNDATARTVRLRIIIDGVTIYDITSSSAASNDTALIAAGFTDSSAGNLLIDGEPLSWKTSCSVDIASSLSETDKIALGYRYFTES